MKLPKYVDLRGLLSFQIMHEIKKKQYCGEDLASIIGERKGNKLTPGTIYPTLKKLRENNLVKFNQNGRKKIYCLTKKGVKEYKISKRILNSLFKKISR
ncbi:hypothetical protein CL617_04995 [archaeon]|nr:hypothetical protein [archaeon]|tara:strand:- start:1472 stop:1768 length:297 start_codon:yes stop_codon:yes gene_type:complete